MASAQGRKMSLSFTDREPETHRGQKSHVRVSVERTEPDGSQTPEFPQPCAQEPVTVPRQQPDLSLGCSGHPQRPHPFTSQQEAQVQVWG